MKLRDGCICIVFELCNPFKNKPIKRFKFNSRIMWRVGWGWLGITILKMSLSDYDIEIESGKTTWIK